MNTSTTKQVLIVSDDIIDTNMGGVGVRNWELSHALAAHCDVTLAIPNKSHLSSEQVNIISYSRNKQDLLTIAQSANVIVVQGFVLHFQPYLATLHRPLAVDLHVPSLLEGLVWHNQDNWYTWIPKYEEYLRVQLELLRFGDFFFCASERQRDYWLGWLHAQKRINPHTFQQSPSLRKLIDVVPFGIPHNPPKSTRAVVKGIHPGIEKTDKVILWSGGLWDWLDPLTLIQAIGRLATQNPEIKVYFLGTHHPNPVVRGMTMPKRAIRLSKELGLFETNVFFGDWVPYQERAEYLAEADLAVISHQDHIETHFSFRTRILDCIWAGLPIVSTSGDSLSEMISNHHLGLVIPPNDISAMSDAILKLLNAKGKKSLDLAFKKMRNELRWDRVAEPLIQFCLNPTTAPDKGSYRTETERISRDKDAYFDKIIQEKNASLMQEIEEKNAFIAQIMHAKKAFLDRLLQEMDAAKEKEPFDPQSYFQYILDQKDTVILNQQQQIEKYQNSFPLRLYSALRRLIAR